MHRVWKTVYAQIDLKRAIVKIKDGSTPANEIEVKIGEGNLTYTESRNMEYTLDRGVLDEVREGDQVPVSVNFDFVWEYLKGSTGGGTPTIEDALKKRGEASDWVSVDADACRPYAVDLEITYSPTPVSCGDMEVILLQDFRYETLDHDLSGGTVAATGQCNVTEATVTRQANSTGALS
jgi:hypothetical protein